MYAVKLDDHVQEQLDALPLAARDAWEQLHRALEVAPSGGRPARPEVPDGLQVWPFAEGWGLVWYVVVDHAREVAVVEVQWFG